MPKAPNREAWLPACTRDTMYRVNAIVASANRINNDLEIEKRHSVCECQYCYYVARGNTVAGQGFTNYVCFACGVEQMYPNTAVPRLCRECAKKHRLCERCGADIDLNQTRELDLHHHSGYP